MDFIGPQTLGTLWRDQVEHVSNRLFLVYEGSNGETISATYAEFWERIRRTARVLSDALGVEQGDNVAVHLSNRPGYLDVWFALAAIGGVTVHSNTKNTVREVTYVLDTADVDTVVSESSYADEVREAMEEAGVSSLLLVDDNTEDYDSLDSLRERADADLPAADVSREDPAQILFTSGTTSDPKGVVLTHGNLLAAAERQTKHLSLRSDDRNSTGLPLYHVNAQTSALSSLNASATLVLFDGFETGKFMSQLKRHRATITAIIGTQLRAMLAKDAVDDENDLRAITYAINVPDRMKEEFEERIDAPLLNLYGMTETMSVVSTAPLTGDKSWPSVGRPTYDREVYVVDESGDPVETGETGEIAVDGERGLTLFQRYYDLPEKTEEAFTEEGWFLTGDYGRFDEDGYLYFVDRKKNIIETRGENVSEQEVEYVLEAHEGVGEAAVVGVPHEIYGEVVKAHVKRSDPDLTEEALLDHAEANLADFKVPAEMEFVDDFPRTTVGKIAKKELRDE
jgi:crotonobetaine/carnitine-CoA ligase